MIPKPKTFIKRIELPTKVEKVERHRSRAWIVFLLTVFLVVASFTAYGVYSFFTTYGLQTPILLRSPIYRLKAEAMISPLPKDGKAKTAVFDVGAIADKIFQLESSGGKHVLCPEGTFNGYGFRQNSFEWICYPTQEEVRELVIAWLSKHIKNGDIESALCLYNKGVEQKGCSYAITYNSL